MRGGAGGAGGGGGAGALLRKEVRELALSEGRPVVQVLFAAGLDLLLAIGTPVAIAVVFQPLGTWQSVGLASMAVVFFCALMGFLGPMPTIADAFAGERERHTLETLLASPLSDRAILVGKMGAQYALVLAHVALLSVVAGLTSAVVFGLPGLLVLVAGLTAGTASALLSASFIVGLGTLLSLRAPTVKKAQEWISYTVLPVFFLGSLLPPLARSGFQVGGPEAQVVAMVALPAAFLAGAAVFNVLAFRAVRRDRLVGR